MDEGLIAGKRLSRCAHPIPDIFVKREDIEIDLVCERDHRVLQIALRKAVDGEG